MHLTAKLRGCEVSAAKAGSELSTSIAKNPNVFCYIWELAPAH